MRRTQAVAAGFSFAALSLAPAVVFGHVSVVSGLATANTTQEVTFGVGHGCAGADTYRVRMEIPAAVTSVRPLRSDFGKVSIEKDTAGTTAAVVWQKADQDALEADIAYYKLVVRMRLPDQPFTTLYFPAYQTCRAADGTLSVTNWVTLPTTVVDGGEDEPAPALNLVPARRSGWNKYTVSQAIMDLGVSFGDALIVWKGTAAYSANPSTTQLIASTPGVTALTALSAGDEVWVRY